MQCTNKGVDSARTPQWECKAELPKIWRLGTTDVSCEGYSSPIDAYILEGSCAVEFTIEPAWQPAPRGTSTEYIVQTPSKQTPTLDSSPELIAVAVVFIIVIVMLVLFYSPRPRYRTRSSVRVHHAYPSTSSSDFVSGYVVGSMSPSPRRDRSPSAETHTSTGYGTTKLR